MASSSSAKIWDFIIVGSGPAGCALAAKLAQSKKQPQVLLLEAGRRNDDKALLVDGQRWTTFLNGDMNWGYKTVPQEHLNARPIDYSRGKGLGGSSTINFGVFTVGARDDYNEWAEIVADDTFRWENMQTRLKSLETFDGTIAEAKNAKYAYPNLADHGQQGPLHVGYAPEWEQDIPLVIEAFQQAGLPWNGDHNSGDPIGMSMCINSSHKGKRVTAADLLRDAPDNLTILPEHPVQRVILDGKKAVGVESKGRKFFASKEVILSAGSLDTPKILMHSGIGPEDQLQQYQIPVVQHLPAVGQGLRDHPFTSICLLRNPATNDRNQFFGDPNAMDSAMKQWLQDGSGPWSRHSCQLVAGWLKLDRLLATPEFQALPSSEQAFLQRETIPHYELASHFPIHFIVPTLTQDYSYVCLVAFLMNQQSRGEVRLQSSNPDDPLLYNANFLSHPYDRRACIEILREVLAISKHEAFQKDTIATILGPQSESDEDLLEFWKNTLGSAWHMTGTVKMGKLGDKDNSDVAVDPRFRVVGVQGLRVADMSVVPVLTNNHTQATAYLTGATCADVLIREYGLA